MTQKGLGESRARTSEQEEFKVVIVGDRGCGKTSQIPAYNQWSLFRGYSDIQHFCVGVPTILVGCKADLRSDKVLKKKLWSLGQNTVTYSQGEEVRRRISAVLYLECSAKCNENVDNVFRETTKQALMGQEGRTKSERV